MPTYEYVCEKCGAHFEKSQSMNDKALTICPREICGQKKWGRGKVKKKISGGAGPAFPGLPERPAHWALAPSIALRLLTQVAVCTLAVSTPASCWFWFFRAATSA